MKLMAHNQQVYEKIITQFNKGCKSICYVQGTGTGKSSIFMKLVKEYFLDKNVLYIVPKKSIGQSISSYSDFNDISDRVTFVTYSAFGSKNKATKENMLKQFDVVFIDEVHHLGSHVYGVNILGQMRELLPKGVYMIGLTATPKRSCDKIDVTAYFEHTVYGLSTIEGIQKGLLPQIEYYVCNEESIQRAREKNYKQVIDYPSSTELLSDLIKDFPRDKWLIFYSNITELKDSLEWVRKLLPEHSIVELHSESSISLHDAKDIIKNTDKVVILSVDMLLEGVHFEGFEGILLTRNVHSDIVFQQILGRVLSVYSKDKPVVIDCTKSAYKVFRSLLAQSYVRNSPVNSRFEDDIRFEIIDMNTPACKYNPIIVKRSLASYKYYDISILLTCLSNGEFVYKDVIFKSLKECCDFYHISYTRVLRLIREYNLSPVDAIDVYFQTILKEPFKYFGVTFYSLQFALDCFEVSFDELLLTMSTFHVKMSWALDYCRSVKSDKFVFRGDTYLNKQECFKKLGLAYPKITFTSIIDTYTQLYKDLAYRKCASFTYRGVTYSCLRDCCRAYKLSQKQVKRLIRCTGRSACSILNELLYY